MGAYVRLDVFFPRVVPVTVAAEVMWIKTSGNGAPARFEVGLAFVELTPEALGILRPLLAHGAESVDRPESNVQAAPRPDSSAEFGTAEPVK